MIFKGLRSRVWVQFPGWLKMRQKNLNDMPEEKPWAVTELDGPVSREAAVDRKHCLFWTLKESRAQFSLRKKCTYWIPRLKMVPINVENVDVEVTDWDPGEPALGWDLQVGGLWTFFRNRTHKGVREVGLGRGRSCTVRSLQQRRQPLPQEPWGWFHSLARSQTETRARPLYPEEDLSLESSTGRRSTGPLVLQRGPGLCASAFSTVQPLHHSDLFALSPLRRTLPGFWLVSLSGNI